jgi:hypothetical protein
MLAQFFRGAPDIVVARGAGALQAFIRATSRSFRSSAAPLFSAPARSLRRSADPAIHSDAVRATDAAAAATARSSTRAARAGITSAASATAAAPLRDSDTLHPENEQTGQSRARNLLRQFRIH